MANPNFIPDDEADSFFASPAKSVPGFIPDDNADGFFAETSSAPAPTPEVSGVNHLTGAITNIANSALGSFGDEAAAGVRSGISGIQSLFGMEPSYQGYDAELAALRGGMNEYSEAYPVESFAGNVAGGMAIPGLGLVGKAKGAVQTAKALALEGSAIGALFGFGSGEGGFENRIQNANTGIAVGGIAAPVFGGAASGIGKLFGSAADDLERSGLGIMRSEAKAARKFKGNTPGEDAPLIQALEGAKTRGLFKDGTSADDVLAANTKQIEELGDSVTKLLSAADEKGAGSVSTKIENGSEQLGWWGSLDDFVNAKNAKVVTEVTPSQIKPPEWNNARAYLKANDVNEDALASQWERRKKLFANNFDGSLSSLNQTKQKLYKAAYKGNTDSADFDKAIARDLREAIEQNADRLLPEEQAGMVKELNRQQGEHLTLRPMLDRAKDQTAMAGGAGKIIQRLAVSPIGGAAALAGAGGLTGDPRYYAASAAMAGLATRTGKFGTSKVLNALAPTGEKAPGMMGAIAPLIAEALGEKAPKPIPFYPSSEKKDSAVKSLFSSPPQKRNIAMSDSSVPPELIKAVIAQESSGNTKAVSDKGATGLMQVMPDTAAEVAVKMKRKGLLPPGPVDLKDPETNVAIGNYYLSEMLDMFNGDIELALTAYHSGPGRVQDLLEQTGGTKLSDIKHLLGPVGKKYAKEVTGRIKA